MSALIPSLLAAALYLAGTLYQARSLQLRKPINPHLLRGIGAVALIAHAIGMAALIFHNGSLALGFFNASSLIAWLVVAVVLVSSLQAPVSSLLLGLYPLAFVTTLLSLFLPDHRSLVIAGNGGLLAHILLSILAYGIITIAVFQAFLLAVQDHQLRNRHPTRFMGTFPPLQTMEHLLFQFLLCGETLLTLALLSGFLFVGDMLADEVMHKTLLSLLAWITFGILLWGRFMRGWRGSLAIRWTLGGFLLLALAYFGSKLVREFILPL